MLRFITATRTRAIVASVLLIALPPLGVFTASLIALVTLREGVVEGFIVLAATLLLTALAFGVLLNNFEPVVHFAVFSALPVYFLALVLRMTASQGLTLSIGAVAVAVLIGVFHLFSVDTSVWRLGVLGGGAVPAFEGAEADVEQMKRDFAKLQHIVVWLMQPAFVLMSAFINLLIARWAHASLDNPGGFAKEFHGLRIDRRLLLLVLAAVGFGAMFAFSGDESGIAAMLRNAFSYTSEITLFSELVVVLAVLCVFQGLAVAHGIAGARKLGKGPLIAAYVLLLFLPVQALLFLALVGLSDPWLNLRERIASARP